MSNIFGAKRKVSKFTNRCSGSCLFPLHPWETSSSSDNILSIGTPKWRDSAFLWVIVAGAAILQEEPRRPHWVPLPVKSLLKMESTSGHPGFWRFLALPHLEEHLQVAVNGTPNPLITGDLSQNSTTWNQTESEIKLDPAFHMGVSINGGTPSSHPNFRLGFSMKQAIQRAWRSSIWSRPQWGGRSSRSPAKRCTRCQDNVGQTWRPRGPEIL